ncbi:MAG: 3-keto-5-aminohexanoate cleavage protein [Roseovarius sp.]
MSRPRIMAAPNGARRSKADHPALPITLDETLITAQACHAAGADALHLHIRDTAGGHSLDAGAYREALAELAYAAPALSVQITTEAAGVFDVAAQMQCLEQVQPAWASISVREIARDTDLADRIYGICAANDTKVQHILYDLEDHAQLKLWQRAGTVRAGQTDMLFVLGRYLTDRSSRASDLDPFLTLDLASKNWMVCAFGPGEHDCLYHAAQMGGDLRVGLENSLAGPHATPWPDCAASVATLAARVAHLNPHPLSIEG